MSDIKNPFGEPAEQSERGALAQSEQQRAVAEVQARMMIARANPRDPRACMDAILNDCARESLAETAVYQYAKGGTDIAGPSIKLAQGVARRWGNIASGIKEISRNHGYSECVAYAWDLETGYYDERQFQVRHWRDTKSGGYALKDEREIYELVANMGQRRKRAVLLAIIPDDVVDAAVRQCEITLTAKADTSPEAMQKMVKAFGDFGVTQDMIEKRIQRRLDAIRPAQVVGLKKIYASLRDEMSSPEDWFDMDPNLARQVQSARKPPPNTGPEHATIEWPKRIPEVTNPKAAGAWVDASGEAYDPNKHGWSMSSPYEGGWPAMKPDGKYFRAKRGAATSLNTDQQQSPPEGQEQMSGGNGNEGQVTRSEVARAILEAENLELLQLAVDGIDMLDSEEDIQFCLDIAAQRRAQLDGAQGGLEV